MKRILLVVIIIVISVGGYFLGLNRGRTKEIISSREKIQNLQDQLLNNKTPKPQISATKTDDSKKEDTKTTSTKKTHTVKDGETLFSIGLLYDMVWTKIADANDINETTPLFVGQKLKIPTAENNQATQDKVLGISIDQTKAQEEQKNLNEKGTDAWRKDPLEVVRHEAPSEYRLSPGDPYSLLSKDLDRGTATVYLQTSEKSYTFYLIQPIEKGEKGIWKIEKILTN